jgi:hypothetical protein
MMRLLLPLLLCACASQTGYTRMALPVVPLQGRPEDVEMPPNPLDEPVSMEFPNPSLVEPIEEGEIASTSGLLVGEGWFVRHQNLKVRYKELRALREADFLIWKAHRRLYEEQIALADQALADVQPQWWEQYVPTVCFFGGVVVTSAVVYAVK